MVKLTIDGREIEAEKDQTILQVARDNGIDIPTLCYNESIEPYGACRLCMVEISRNGRTRLVASCMYQVEEGLDVKTSSPRVLDNRRIILELLLARCSDNKVIKDLARKMGIAKLPFRKEYIEKKDCIVCGLCVRVCEQIVGVSAISLINRGITKKPAAPFLESADDCIGCGSCYYICPTHAIKMEDKNGTRYIHNWNVEFKLRKCKVCGNYWAPEKQIDYIKKTWNLSDDIFDVCPSCK
jgi:bidirectional [NiFe] hydrogenase diaphorase subunit